MIKFHCTYKTDKPSAEQDNRFNEAVKEFNGVPNGAGYHPQTSMRDLGADFDEVINPTKRSEIILKLYLLGFNNFSFRDTAEPHPRAVAFLTRREENT